MHLKVNIVRLALEGFFQGEPYLFVLPFGIGRNLLRELQTFARI